MVLSNLFSQIFDLVISFGVGISPNCFSLEFTPCTRLTSKCFTTLERCLPISLKLKFRFRSFSDCTRMYPMSLGDVVDLVYCLRSFGAFLVDKKQKCHIF
eukprot:NODE_14_length_42432_cov_0.433799.p28 type:complete len:100 gc:universal NODE_14_length_42432_cov_0.433799:34502-34203(-)